MTDAVGLPFDLPRRFARRAAAAPATPPTIVPTAALIGPRSAPAAAPAAAPLTTPTPVRASFLFCFAFCALAMAIPRCTGKPKPRQPVQTGCHSWLDYGRAGSTEMEPEPPSAGRSCFSTPRPSIAAWLGGSFAKCQATRWPGTDCRARDRVPRSGLPDPRPASPVGRCPCCRREEDRRARPSRRGFHRSCAIACPRTDAGRQSIVSTSPTA